MKVAVIIAAGGRGRRLGAPVPKQLLRLGDRTVLQWSVDAFDASDRVDEIVVVLPEDIVSAGQASVVQGRTPLTLVAGGERRQDSVANGFSGISDDVDVVVIHDGARPFVTEGLIVRTIEAAASKGAAVAGLVASDTVKRTLPQDGGQVVVETLPRAAIVMAQTPQAFRREVLRDALAGAAGDDVTDEALLVERTGRSVYVVAGDPRNIKITTAVDLELARRLSNRGEPAVLRTGTGYDIHRTVEGRALMLGGVQIPAPWGLLGHSDADVLCHAVTDAVLGAAGAGDIGRHFPDTDPEWKDVSSIDLLRRAMVVVRAKGFDVENVDAVVIAERPKIAPYVDRMCEQMATALGIARERVSVKGTTHEGLGPVGREEAIAAQAVALLRADTKTGRDEPQGS